MDPTAPGSSQTPGSLRAPAAKSRAPAASRSADRFAKGRHIVEQTPSRALRRDPRAIAPLPPAQQHGEHSPAPPYGFGRRRGAARARTRGNMSSCPARRRSDLATKLGRPASRSVASAGRRKAPQSSTASRGRFCDAAQTDEIGARRRNGASETEVRCGSRRRNRRGVGTRRSGATDSLSGRQCRPVEASCRA